MGAFLLSEQRESLVEYQNYRIRGDIRVCVYIYIYIYIYIYVCVCVCVCVCMCVCYRIGLTENHGDNSTAITSKDLSMLSSLIVAIAVAW